MDRGPKRFTNHLRPVRNVQFVREASEELSIGQNDTEWRGTKGNCTLPPNWALLWKFLQSLSSQRMYNHPSQHCDSVLPVFHGIATGFHLHIGIFWWCGWTTKTSTFYSFRKLTGHSPATGSRRSTWWHTRVLNQSRLASCVWFLKEFAIHLNWLGMNMSLEECFNFVSMARTDALILSTYISSHAFPRTWNNDSRFGINFLPYCKLFPIRMFWFWLVTLIVRQTNVPTLWGSQRSNVETQGVMAQDIQMSIAGTSSYCSLTWVHLILGISTTLQLMNSVTNIPELTTFALVVFMLIN